MTINKSVIAQRKEIPKSLLEIKNEIILEIKEKGLKFLERKIPLNENFKESQKKISFLLFQKQTDSYIEKDIVDEQLFNFFKIFSSDSLVAKRWVNIFETKGKLKNIFFAKPLFFFSSGSVNKEKNISVKITEDELFKRPERIGQKRIQSWKVSADSPICFLKPQWIQEDFNTGSGSSAEVQKEIQSQLYFIQDQKDFSFDFYAQNKKSHQYEKIDLSLCLQKKTDLIDRSNFYLFVAFIDFEQEFDLSAPIFVKKTKETKPNSLINQTDYKKYSESFYRNKIIVILSNRCQSLAKVFNISNGTALLLVSLIALCLFVFLFLLIGVIFSRLGYVSADLIIGTDNSASLKHLSPEDQIKILIKKAIFALFRAILFNILFFYIFPVEGLLESNEYRNSPVLLGFADNLLINIKGLLYINSYYWLTSEIILIIGSFVLFFWYTRINEEQPRQFFGNRKVWKNVLNDVLIKGFILYPLFWNFLPWSLLRKVLFLLINLNIIFWIWIFKKFINFSSSKSLNF